MTDLLFSRIDWSGVVGVLLLDRRSLLLVAFLAALPSPATGQNRASMYRQACDSGDMGGCVNLGFIYQFGQGIPEDLDGAGSLYERGCDGGAMLGCVNLGLMYAVGRGVSQDLARAVVFFEQACDGEELEGCANLGYLYANGLGVNLDPTRALSLNQRACDGGEMQGCVNLGDMYKNGLGVVTQDLARTLNLYQRACGGGEMQGCTSLGDMHMYGVGVPQDLTRAVNLYERARHGACLPPTVPYPLSLPEPSSKLFSVAPALLNRQEILRAMERAYPPFLRDAGTGGVVRLCILVNEDGIIQDYRIAQTSGRLAVDNAALSLLGVYRYSPARNQDGEAIPVWINLPVTFRVR